MFTTIRTLNEQGVSNRQIAKLLGIDKKTVLRTLRNIRKGQTAPARKSFPSKLAPFASLVAEKLALGLSAVQIHQDLRPVEGFRASYETVKRLVRKLRHDDPEVFCRMRYEPGEEAQVDFGYIGRFPHAGRHVKGWVFVMVLCFSRMEYFELVLDQSVATFLSCLRNAFEFFGGVPRRLKPDNLKSAILVNQLGERLYQEDFAAFCRHYGVTAEPARFYKATDKGRVESAVGYVKGNCFKGRSFDSFGGAAAWLRDWMTGTAHQRLHRTTRRRPIDLFEQEKSRLLPLPAAAYELARWGAYKVRKDCHISLEGSFYSVPYPWVGKYVDVRATANLIEVFAGGQLLARHPRSQSPGRDVTDPAHYPSAKRKPTQAIHAERLDKIRSVGPAARCYVGLLRDRRETVYTDHLKSLAALVGEYPQDILERAFQRALFYQAFGYQVVRAIVEKRLYQLPLETLRSSNDDSTSLAPSAADLDSVEINRSLSEYDQLLTVRL